MNTELSTTALLLIEENDNYYVIPRDQLERFHVAEDQKAELKKVFGEDVTGYVAHMEGLRTPEAEGVRGPAVEWSRGPAVEGVRGPAVMGVRGPAVEGVRGPAVEGLAPGPGIPVMAFMVPWPIKY